MTSSGSVMRRLVLALTAAVATVVTSAVPGAAIVGPSEPDTAHPNVGVLLPTASSPVARWCGATPVSARVLVLAGHCALLRRTLFGETDGWVTFDPDIRGDLGEQAPWTYTGGYPTYHGTLVSHPRYDLKGSEYDVAVLVLDQPLAGVAAEPLPPSGILDDLQAAGTLRDQALTLVGYGTTERLPGNVFVDGGQRRSAEQQVQSLGAAVLRHNGGQDGGTACNFDSGGPLFAAGRLVGVLSAGDAACSTLNISARLDVPAVRTWLADQVAAAG